MTVPPATIRHHIDGGPVTSGIQRTFENLSPVDGSLVSLVAEAGADEVDAAVAAAKRALRGPWAGLSVADRGKLLHAVADEIDRRFEDFVAAEVADTGMPESFARTVVVPRGAANLRFFADFVKNLPADTFHLETPDGAGALNYVVRDPQRLHEALNQRGRQGPWPERAARSGTPSMFGSRAPSAPDRRGRSPAAHWNRWWETPCRAAGKRSPGKQPMDTARIHRFASRRGDAPIGRGSPGCQYGASTIRTVRTGLARVRWTRLRPAETRESPV